MALINCEECDKEFSDKAESCPNCGCPITAKEVNENIKYTKIVKEKPPVEIIGDEAIKYSEYTLTNFKPCTKWIDATSTLLSIIIFFIIINASEGNIGTAFITSLILYVIFNILIHIFNYFRPKYKKEKNIMIEAKEKSKIIKEYLEKNIPIHQDMKLEFKTIKVINKSSLTKYEAMFYIYMEAYINDADAIVLNSDTTSTKVSGNVTTSHGRVSGKTTSTVTYNIMATLVKIEE